MVNTSDLTGTWMLYRREFLETINIIFEQNHSMAAPLLYFMVVLRL
jgi:hypothetical protein